MNIFQYGIWKWPKPWKPTTWTPHTTISYLKSGLRLIGFSFLGAQRFETSAIVLGIAEVIGVVEEMVV
jgi:hypothetical protein